jgi:hypothetical protein
MALFRADMLGDTAPLCRTTLRDNGYRALSDTLCVAITDGDAAIIEHDMLNPYFAPARDVERSLPIAISMQIGFTESPVPEQKQFLGTVLVPLLRDRLGLQRRDAAPNLFELKENWYSSEIIRDFGSQPR